ncbi:lytic transglycosylase domain-containing protein [Mesorhizobium sp. M0051]|uniref:lytic transglycosylase domain-containing protein n=1 Tax=Mesorhizobium sp. M0051 TaxID=2956862 RepID=UPI00333BFB8B
MIDRALLKPFDPIACQAAAARSEGQGRPDARQSLRTLIAQQFAAGKSGRRSLALDGSEHGGRVFARLDGGACAVIRRGVTMLCACVMLLPSASAVYAQPLSHGEGPALSNAKTSSADPWSAHIREAAKRFAIPERLLRAVMHVESVGDVHALSSKGAMGLMQIMPATWEELRIKHHLGDDPYQPHDNILAGAAYLREMLDRFGRSGFLAAYNAGPGRYQDHLATGRPLPRETVDYVRKLAPLINGSVPIPLRARQGAGRASALEAAIFTHVAYGIARLRRSIAGPMFPSRLCSQRSAHPACDRQWLKLLPILPRWYRHRMGRAVKVACLRPLLSRARLGRVRPRHHNDRPIPSQSHFGLLRRGNCGQNVGFQGVREGMAG